MVSAGSAPNNQLSDEHRRGLKGLAVGACISLTCTSVLFLFLSFKLAQSGLDRRRRRRHPPPPPPKPPIHLVPGDTGSLGAGAWPPAAAAAAAVPAAAVAGDDAAAHNPFPILIYNMLLINMSDSVANSIHIAWLAEGRIGVGTATCWAQGWFYSNGKLGTSAFLSAISIITYLTVVRGYKTSPQTLRLVIAGLWVFILFASVVGIIVTGNGRAHGGWYGRASAWCWISDAYGPWRFWTHYFWIICLVPLSLGLNLLTAFALWRENRSSKHLPFRRTAVLTGGETAETAAPRPSGHHPAYFVYPILSALMMTPLVAAGVTCVAGGRPSVRWFCAAGTAYAYNGLCMVLLWVSTMVLTSPQARADAGLARFQFMRTDPAAYGNIIWISSDAGAHDDGDKKNRGRAGGGTKAGARWWLWWSDGAKGRMGRGGRRGLGHGRGISEESLRRGVLEENGIQMNVVTTVVIEHVGDETEIRDSSEFSGKDLGSVRSSRA